MKFFAIALGPILGVAAAYLLATGAIDSALAGHGFDLTTLSGVKIGCGMVLSGFSAFFIQSAARIK